MRKKSTAALLCFFFGGVGIHWYYLGRVGMGVLYTFTAGLIGIGALVNLIQLLVMNDATFNQKYNNFTLPASQAQ